MRLRPTRPSSHSLSLRSHAHVPHHAGLHVIGQMAVERPIADRISGKIPSHLTARLDDYRMFARSVITMAGDEFEEMAVDVDRMAHHGVIDKVHAHPLALNEGDGFMQIGRAHV